MLTLYEELYLLALDEAKGNLIWFARKSLVFPIAGLILAELALLEKIHGAEKLRLVANGLEKTGDPILDETLEKIRTSDKPRKLAYWVSQLSLEPKKLKQRIGEQLVKKSVLIQDEKRFFRKDPDPGTTPAAPDKFQVKYDLRASILSNGELNLRHLTLLEMIDAGNLLSLIFTQDEIEAAEQIIHRQLLTSALGIPVMELVEEIGEAVSSVQEDEIE